MSIPDAQLVADALLRHRSCLIVTHINPEGDAIGSLLALALALEQHGIVVSCYDRDGVPENCRFLPGWEHVSRNLPDAIPPLVVYVDADRLERCGLSREQLPGALEFVRIDHHSGELQHSGPSLVDTHAAATGELIFALLPYLKANLTPDIATCLLDALMVDTGRFSYTNTSPLTHRIAADLLAAGADLPAIVEWTWGRMNYVSVKLLGFALASLQTGAGGRIAWSMLREEDFRMAGAEPTDTEGVIDHIRIVNGARVAALFSEKQGSVRVSLRSQGCIDVAQLARQFGGGGHVKAAGLTFDGPMEYAVCEVLRAIEALLTE